MSSVPSLHIHLALGLVLAMKFTWEVVGETAVIDWFCAVFPPGRGVLQLLWLDAVL